MGDPCKAEAASADYNCKFDASVEPSGECKRVVKNEIVPSSVKQFTEWTGADCSRRTCPRSTSWTQLGNNVKDTTHICTHKIQQECSDQGVCDRATGLCECFPGFTGSACQRTACPDDCSGHGTCRSNRDFAYDWAIAKTTQIQSDDTETDSLSCSRKPTSLPTMTHGTLTCTTVASAMRATVVQVALWWSAPRRLIPLMTSALPLPQSRTTSCNTTLPSAV